MSQVRYPVLEEILGVSNLISDVSGYVENVLSASQLHGGLGGRWRSADARVFECRSTRHRTPYPPRQSGTHSAHDVLCRESWLMSWNSRPHLRMIAPARFLLSQCSHANCRTIDWYKEWAPTQEQSVGARTRSHQSLPSLSTRGAGVLGRPKNRSFPSFSHDSDVWASILRRSVSVTLRRYHFWDHCHGRNRRDPHIFHTVAPFLHPRDSSRPHSRVTSVYDTVPARVGCAEEDLLPVENVPCLLHRPTTSKRNPPHLSLAADPSRRKAWSSSGLALDTTPAGTSKVLQGPRHVRHRKWWRPTSC